MPGEADQRWMLPKGRERCLAKQRHGVLLEVNAAGAKFRDRRDSNACANGGVGFCEQREGHQGNEDRATGPVRERRRWLARTDMEIWRAWAVGKRRCSRRMPSRGGIGFATGKHAATCRRARRHGSTIAGSGSSGQAPQVVVTGRRVPDCSRRCEWHRRQGLRLRRPSRGNWRDRY